MKLQFLTMSGCPNCAQAKVILDRVKTDYPDLEVEEVDIASPKGQEMVAKYQIMASPGVVIDSKLFSTGGLDEKKLRKRLEELKQ